MNAVALHELRVQRGQHRAEDAAHRLAAEVHVFRAKLPDTAEMLVVFLLALTPPNGSSSVRGWSRTP